MANSVFIIFDTEGTPIAAIQPNTLNGPGGVQQSSDLSMFGQGYALWGAASDQNDYRLLENFACAQSVTNPSPIQPMGASELGAGNGINEPIIGQMWFNITNQSLYVFTSSGWGPVSIETTVSATPPSNPTIGQLWYNTAIPQLEIWNGSVWVSVAALYMPLAGGTMTGPINMGSQFIHNLQPPVSAFDAANKQYVDTVAGGSGAGIFVPLAGGTMTGQLVMSSTNIVVNNGNINVGTGNIHVTSGTLTMTTPAAGIAMNANGRITNITTTAVTDAVNANYGDVRWLVKASGTTQTVTSTTVFNGTTQVSAAPVNPTDVVNKAYADASPGYPTFLVTPVVVYDSGVFSSGTSTGSQINVGWTNYSTVAHGLPAGIKAVILEGYYVGNSPGDGSSPNINYSGFILIRNNTSQGTGTYPSQTSYCLVKSNNTEYKYFNPPSGVNQATFPVRQVAQGSFPIGSFDYTIPLPVGGSGGLTGAAIRIVGYYS